MQQDSDQERGVETFRGVLPQAQRMSPAEMAALSDIPPMSPQELDMRQESLGTRRKAPGPPLPEVAALENLMEVTPDVPPTECADPPIEGVSSPRRRR